MAMTAISGCMPGIQREVIGPDREAALTPTIPSESIDKKIVFVEGILEDKNLSDDEREIALKLLAAYKDVKSLLESEDTTSNREEIIGLLFVSLSQLSERYFLKKGRDDQAYSTVMNLYTGKRDEILNAYLSGDYQGVINLCIELENVFGPDALTPDIGVLFAFSLARKDMMEEASNIGEGIIDELEGNPDLIQLKAGIIGWQLSMGEREKALKLYEKLMDNLDEREAVLREVRQRISGEDPKTADDGRVLPAEDSEDDSIDGEDGEKLDPMVRLLRDVDRLVRDHAYTDAKLLLIKQKLKTEETSDLETIDQAMKTVELAEEKYLEGGGSAVSNQKETLEMASKLIEEEKFEEAIKKLEAIESKNDPSSETREIKALAVEKLINRERNRSAQLFLMAKNTKDATKKEELLVASYHILKSLVEKYPNSKLTDRLKSHLESVEDELKKLKEKGND